MLQKRKQFDEILQRFNGKHILRLESFESTPLNLARVDLLIILFLVEVWVLKQKRVNKR